MDRKDIKTLVDAAQKILQLETYLINENRVFLDSKNQETLNYILEIFNAEHTISSATKLYRARLGCIKDGLTVAPLPREEMEAPPADKAIGGRVSFPGMFCLYLATTEGAAMAEMRPWKESYITVATFRPRFSLRLRDLRKLTYHIEKSDYYQQVISGQVRDYFSRPMEHQEEHLKYVISQYLAAAIKAKGYQGMIYDSGLDDYGSNIALFDMHSAEQLDDCKLYKTTNINYIVRNCISAEEIKFGTK